MSIPEMQAALSRLYVDGAFFDVFCLDPQRALHSYSLTERETRALTGIDREAIRRFALSLRVKTWKRFSSSYRLLYSLDRARIYSYYLRFYEIRKMRPNETFFNATVELGEFLEESLLGDPDLPPYASDLARYERLFYEARHRPRSGAAAQPVAEEPLTAGSVPVLREGVRVEAFDWDMSAIEKAIEEGSVPRDAERGEHYVVFQSRPQPGRAKKFQVAALMQQMLSLCDGSRNVRAIAAELEARSGRSGLLRSALDGTGQLVRLGLVEVKAG